MPKQLCFFKFDLSIAMLKTQPVVIFITIFIWNSTLILRRYEKKSIYCVFIWILPFLYEVVFFIAFVSAPYVLNAKLAPVFGLRQNPSAAARAEKILFNSLSKIESIWLKGKGRFLLGSSQPSIADLSLVCEIMQLEVYRNFWFSYI